MTSKKSLHNAFGFTVRDTARSSFLISLILLIPAIFVAGICVLNYAASKEKPELFAGEYIYSNFFQSNILIFAVAIIWSCLFAMKTFGFLSKKKECNVYLSLGISRSKLFLAKYIGGAVCIIGTIGLYFFLELLVNCFVNGLSNETWIVWAFSFLSALVTCLAAYTVATYAFVNAGNVIEAIIFTFFYGIFWPIFTHLTNRSFATLVYGNAYNTAFYDAAYEFSSNIWWIDIFGSYTEQVVKYENLSKEFVKWQGFEAPDWSGVIFAVAVITVIVIICERQFRNRTSEICGFVLKSKNLYKTFAALYGILMGLTVISNFTTDRLVAAVAGIAVMLAFVCGVWMIIEKKVKAPLKAATVLTVISVLFVGGCYIGYGDDIPEKSEIKAIDVSVDFSYLSDGDPVNYTGYYTKDSFVFSAPTAVRFPIADNYRRCYTTLTSERDVDWVMDIHSDLIKEGYKLHKANNNIAQQHITICYTLKNGDTVIRHYPFVGIETQKKILGFSKTDNGRELLDLMLTGSEELYYNLDKVESAVTTNNFSNHYYQFFGRSLWYESIANNIYRLDLINCYMGVTTDFILADKEFNYIGMVESASTEVDEILMDNKFFSALITDIKEQTVEEKYFHSPEDELCTILVPKESWDVSSVEYYTAWEAFTKLKKSDPYYGDFAEYYKSITFGNFGNNEGTVPSATDEVSVEYYGYDNDYSYGSAQYVENYEKNKEALLKCLTKNGQISNYFNIYVITKDMTNTIEYLKAVGLYDKLSGEREKPVKVCVDTTSNIVDIWQTDIISDQFYSNAINPENSVDDFAYWERTGREKVIKTKEITDSDIVSELYEKSLMVNGKLCNNYVAEFYFDDGKQISRIIPAEAMTDELLAAIVPDNS